MRQLRIFQTAVLIAAGLAAGCASSPASDPASAAARAEADSTTTEAATASPEPKVVETTAQAAKYLSEEELKRAYRECMRKLRRVTGSRIPRNACQGSAGLYSGAYNQVQEGEASSGGAALPSN